MTLMNAELIRAQAEDVLASRAAAEKAEAERVHAECLEAMIASAAGHISNAAAAGNFSVTAGLPNNSFAVSDLIEHLRRAGYVVEVIDNRGDALAFMHPRKSLRISWGKTSA